MQINRLIFPGFWFDRQPLSHARQLAQMGVGGFCLYGGTTQQIKTFCQEVRSASPLPQLLICADYEDGLGRWVPDAPRLAPNLALGAADSQNLAYDKGLLTACRARELGIDWVFAPVADLADTPDNPIVNTRAFSAFPQQATRLAGAFMQGLTKGGVLNCLKHFPGHGRTHCDSHLTLPTLPLSRQDLLAKELIPFQKLFPLADGVMTAHLLLPQLDAVHPASLSPTIQTELLKKELGWKGCVLTDALLMQAIGDEKQAALNALNAGTHILLAMKDPLALADFLQKQSFNPALIEKACAQIEALCQRLKQIRQSPSPVCPDETTFNQRAAQAACTLTGEFLLHPGDRLRVVALGDEEKIGWEPLRRVLQDAGITFTQDPNAKLLILSLSNYKSFKGHINLSPQEISHALRQTELAPQCALVCLGSPFAALPLKKKVQAVLYTFSPLPAFQETAGEILLGKRQADGKLPVCL